MVSEEEHLFHPERLRAGERFVAAHSGQRLASVRQLVGADVAVGAQQQRHLDARFDEQRERTPATRLQVIRVRGHHEDATHVAFRAYRPELRNIEARRCLASACRLGHNRPPSFVYGKMLLHFTAPEGETQGVRPRTRQVRAERGDARLGRSRGIAATNLRHFCDQTGLPSYR